MTFNWKAQVALVVLAVAALGGLVAWNNQHQRAIGKRDIQIHQYEVANHALRAEADSLAKAYRVDTLRLTRLKLRTDTLTQTVERWKRDTLTVVEYVTRADSTIKACTQALSTCDERVGVAQRGWAGARDEMKVLKASFPSPVQKWRWGAAGALVGAVVGRLVRP